MRIISNLRKLFSVTFLLCIDFIGRISSRASLASTIYHYNSVLLIYMYYWNLAAIRLEEDNGSDKKFIITSGYLQYDKPSPPQSEEVAKFVQYCEDENFQVIIWTDANAHNIARWSTPMNRRGESLLEFIPSRNLIVLNWGSDPSFVTQKETANWLNPKFPVCDYTVY